MKYQEVAPKPDFCITEQ